MFKRTFSFILIAIFAASLFGCSSHSSTPTSGDGASNYKVTLVVSKDFGKELILERKIEIKAGTNAIDALRIVASIKTEYGGSFISSINGIVSSSKSDWFFYINGISANVGAGDYVLRDGDIEHWDFRDWSYLQSVPAIIGDYPQPFLSGFKGNKAPVVVLYEEAFAEEAESLAESLTKAGVAQVTAIPAGQLSAESKTKSNLIIIAGIQNDLVSQLNDLHKRLGFYAYLEDGEIISLNAAGKPSGEYGAGCGLIQATQNPWNPKGTGACENVVWMITGTDAQGVVKAATALVNSSSELLYAYAVVVNNGAVIKIP